MTPLVILVVALVALQGAADSAVVRSQLKAQLQADEWVQYGESFFKKSSGVKANWAMARTLCKDMHNLADLTSIGSRDEQDFLVSEFGSHFWIGYNDLDSEGHFSWANGHAKTFTNWSDYEPSNSDGGEDCTEVYPLESGAHVWNDAQCKDIYPFVCQVRLP